jgi:LacI family transcriptional regulator
VDIRQANIEDLLGLRQGWTPIAMLFTSRPAYELRLLELARQQRWRLISLSKFDGGLPADLSVNGALTGLLPTHEKIVALRDRSIPVVRIGNWHHPDDAQVPAVIPDHQAAGRMAGDHFAERDFKHVGCVGRNPWGDNESIYDAFAARAEQRGIQCHLLREDARTIDQLPSPERWHWRRRHFMSWLTELPKPVGLLFFGDLQADRACQWVLEAGMSVPADVAVLGIGNDQVLCECTTVPVSSVEHDSEGLADAAVDTLAKLIAGKPVEQTTIPVPPLGIVTRQSTDVLAAADPNVATALRYMWDHVAEDLSVDQIAEQVGTSRRTLEKAFTRELGRGINAEFQRRRLEKARELVLHTDLKITDLANALNFSSHNYFCRAFRQAFGTSPARYRRDHDRSA